MLLQLLTVLRLGTTVCLGGSQRTSSEETVFGQNGDGVEEETAG